MNKIGMALAVCGLFLMATTANSAIITFDDLIVGQTSYSYDGDGDGIMDAVFSTTDPFGFNTVGPGPNMTYIDEPGLEGSTIVNNPGDLRVDFLEGARNSISFGFALDDFEETPDTWTKFSLYDSNDNLLGSAMEIGEYTTLPGGGSSEFPEGEISLAFAGTAAYGVFDFNNSSAGGQRYIIDNFAGTYGSTEVPEPATLSMLLLGCISLCGYGLKRKK